VLGQYKKKEATAGSTNQRGNESSWGTEKIHGKDQERSAEGSCQPARRERKKTGGEEESIRVGNPSRKEQKTAKKSKEMKARHNRERRMEKWVHQREVPYDEERSRRWISGLPQQQEVTQTKTKHQRERN